MKKLICSVLAAAAAVTSCMMCGCGGDATVNYTLSEDETYYIVSGVSGNKQALKSYEIPSEYSAKEGDAALPVKEIGESAFFGCSALLELTIADSVTKIGALAFAQCGMEHVTIPDSVTYIGYSAFGMCKGLREIVIPSSVTYLGDRAFMACSCLERAEVYATIEDLKYNTFYNSVVQNAGTYYYSTSLTEVVLPATLKKIHETALYGNAITDIYFMGSEAEWSEVYFYTTEEDETTGEAKEVTVDKDEIVGTSVTIHYDYVPA